ncbi:hypothetical protein HDU98_009463 [Podochytrium sp. JEL0797]|nr:hypothetical protein HDU98_009463 [Podochytrium sp. JEL0797]
MSSLTIDADSDDQANALILKHTHELPQLTAEPKDTAEREFVYLARRFVACCREGNYAEFQFPSDFVCPITHELMIDPVSTVLGSVYERKAITRHLRNSNTNPEDGRTLRSKNLVKDCVVKQRIEAFEVAVLETGDVAAIAELRGLLPLPTEPPPQYDEDHENVLLVAEKSGSGDATPLVHHHQFLDPYAVPTRDAPEASHAAYIQSAKAINTAKLAFAAISRLVSPNVKNLHHLPVDSIRSVLGSYMHAKLANVVSRGRSSFGEYKYSTNPITVSNHVFHKLERLSRMVLLQFTGAEFRYIWCEVIKPFRRELFNRVYAGSPIVRAFGDNIAGGHLMCPDLDDYSLGLQSAYSGMFTRRGTGSLAAWRNQMGSDRRPSGLELLSQVHTVFLIDDSGSMAGGAVSYGFSGSLYSDFAALRYKSRWDQVRDLLADFAPIVTQYDPHGLSLFFLNAPTIHTKIRSSDAVNAVFRSNRPNGGTPLGRRVNDILDAYMTCLRYDRNLKPLNLVVFTDGESQDEEVLKHSIESHVHHVMNRGYVAHQLGIEFVQVGDDAEATRHLREIEEEVSWHHMNYGRDIVGVTPFLGNQGRMLDSELLTNVILSGIDARVNAYMRRRNLNV